MQSILFVCLGNICRSPAAEGIMRKLAQQAGLALRLDSAGTGGWHQGEPPYAPMVAAAARRGYDLSALRARQLLRADFSRFERILVMDHANLRDARVIAAGQGVDPELFLSLASGLATDEVPDPYYTRRFDESLDLIEAAARSLILRLTQDRTEKG
jgi:protein-tyrosine phosphatase